MGMFEKRGDSTLLHPVSSRVSGQEASVYRLAGQILAKAIVEVLLRGICTKLSDLRLTRTLLASILGTPIHYKVSTLYTRVRSEKYIKWQFTFKRPPTPVSPCIAISMNIFKEITRGKETFF